MDDITQVDIPSISSPAAMTTPIHLCSRNSTSPGSLRRRNVSYGLKSLHISLSMRSPQPLHDRCETCSLQPVPQDN